MIRTVIGENRFYNDFNGYEAMNKEILCELWEGGDQLHEAWFHLCDERNKQLFRKSEPVPGGTNGQQRSMEHQLQMRITDGELTAIGIEHGPASDKGPVVIPRHFFSQLAYMNWDTYELDAFGRKFSDIRVVNSSKIVPVGETSINQNAEEKQKKEMGRPKLIPLVCEVIRQINSENGFAGLSVKSMHKAIRERCQAVHKVKFPRPSTPSKSTINQALRLVPITVK